MMRNVFYVLLSALGLLGGVAGYAQDVVIKGAGASFPYPLYRHWIDLYSRETGARISYESVGSGEGIRRLLAGEIDFGATDAFLSDEKMSEAGNPVYHLPTCAGAVVLAYNLPGRPHLHLTGDVIADIFMRKIRKWSDSRIVRLNPQAKLPDLDIVVLHRADSSGTTYVFTDYLSKVSSDWSRRIGRGKEIHWPTGLGMERNDGIADFLTEISGSIGYLEYGYAQRQNLPCAEIRNRSGEFIAPSETTITAAADVDIPDDTRIMITDTPAEQGYPISTFTWLIFQTKDNRVTGSAAKDHEVQMFLGWILGKGTGQFNGLYYAPLPDRVVMKARKVVENMFAGGDS